MLKRNVHRSSGELPISAISEKSRSHAVGVIRGLGTAPTSKKTSDSERAEIGRFSACVITQALLAGFSASRDAVSLKSLLIVSYNNNTLLGKANIRF